ncbi:MAG: baseplate J/gp47 family protein [Candidatus Andersenbacteria bacterium]|nr:baseplate J/gp47 family protein [Candidatus Andersenbacteria bacterium]MBI3250316.1 baseplate J/gp47 family protein [Candidatus Andersenbacteria bacterium]
MQDIRPNKPKDSKEPFTPPESLPSPKQLYTKPPKKLPGAKVPVAALNVPKLVPKKTSSPKLLTGAVEKLKAASISRPTSKPVTSSANQFKNVTPVVRTKSKTTSMRLGGRERKLIAVISGLIIVVLGLAVYLFLPKATITLALKTAPLLLDETLTLQQTDNPQTGVIPATVFSREVHVEGAAPVTSTETVGAKATGVARIVNGTIDEQKIKERSRLVTEDGTLFYMQTHAIIPPQGAVTVAIEADLAGEGGNIEPQRLNFAALDTASQSLVYAMVDTKLTGGSGEQVLVVREADLTAARESAGATAKTQIEQEIRAQLTDEFTILEESWTGEIKAFETDAKEGTQQEAIPYKADVAVRVFAYKETALEESLRGALEARLDDEYMLFPEPISYTKSVGNVDWEKGEADLNVRVTHTTIPTFSIDTLQEKLAGRSEEEARSYLESLPGVEGVEVKLSPFWALGIPRIEKRIEVNLVSDRQP